MRLGDGDHEDSDDNGDNITVTIILRTVMIIVTTVTVIMRTVMIILTILQ